MRIGACSWTLLSQPLTVSQADVYLSDYAEITTSLTGLGHLIMYVRVCDMTQHGSKACH